MRPVSVTAKDNIFQSDGTLLIAKGTNGQVKSVYDPPYISRYEVTFDVSGVPTDVWVSSTDLTWADGLIGPARAIIQLRSTVIVDCEFQEITPVQDLVIDGKLLPSSGHIKLITDDGYEIHVTANANNDIQLDYRLSR